MLSLRLSFENTRFKCRRWITGSAAEIDKFAKGHGSSMAEDIDGLPVFMASAAWDLKYEAERWPEIAFADIKDYQKEHA